MKDFIEILIVDDTPENLTVLSNILRKENYKVRFAKNGEQALRSVKAKLPDLIFLDVMMPVMDGFETCKRLKADSDAKDIPILFISARSDFEGKTKAYEVGGLDFIEKPFNAKEVLLRVRTYVGLYKTQKELAHKTKVLLNAEKIAKIGNWEWDVKNNIVIWSDGLYEIYGLKKSEFKASFEGYRERLHEEDKERVVKIIGGALKELGKFSFEERIIRPNGEIRFLRSWGEIIVNVNNEPVKAVGVCMDITNTQKMQLELQTIFNMSSAVGGKDYFDAMTKELANYLEVDEVLIGEYMHENNSIMTLSWYAYGNHQDNMEYELGGTPCEFIMGGKECVWKKGIQKEFPKDEYLVDHNIEGYIGIPLRRHDKVIGGIIILSKKTIQEVDRKQAVLNAIKTRTETEIERIKYERELHKYEKYFSVSMDMMAIANMEGYFENINPKFTEVLGYSDNEILNKPFIEFVHPLDKKETLRIFEKLLKGNPIIEFESRYQCKNGKYKNLVWTGTKDQSADLIYVSARDITDLVKERKKSSLYFYILDNSLNEIYIIDAHDLKFLDANIGAQKNIGYSVDELKKMRCIDIKPDVTLDEFNLLLQPLRNKQVEHIVLETTHKREDGSTYIVFLSIQLTELGGKEIFVTSGIDITDRIEREKELSITKNRLSNVYEYANVGIAYASNEARVLSVNSKFAEILEYENKEEIYGKHIGEYTYSEDLDLDLDMLDKIKKKEISNFQIEKRYVTKNNNVKWVDLRVSAIVDENGELKNFIGMVIDITSRKESEKKLVDLTKRLSLAKNSAHIGIWEYDIINDYLLWDDKMYELFEVDKEDFSYDYNGWANCVHRDDLERTSGELEASIKEDIDFDTKFRIVCKNGTIKHIKANAIIDRDENGKPLSAIGVNYDITREVELVQNLSVAKQKAEESDRLKSAFLANMSHEIRTPMNGLLGFLGFLDDENLSHTERSRYIDIMRKSGNRLLDTINDIIEFSKIESREVTLNISEVNLVSLMEYYYEFFLPETMAKELAFRYKVDYKTDLFIRTDKNKLNSILTNLIKNAIKFTNTGCIEYGCHLKNKKLLFYVKDTGKGIAKDKLQMIFKRFVQADTKLTRQYEGSGLGLAICKHYVNMLGGEIIVESEEDIGTTFSFSLPYEPGSKQNKVNTPIPGNNIKKDGRQNDKTILIAEDDDFSYMFLEILLEDYKKIRAYNGEEAISLFELNSDISLVLMDLKMPEVDGYDATRRIREIDQDIPIIAQTAFTNPDHISQLYEVGCTDYIAKPIDGDKLLRLMNKYMFKK